MKKIMMLLLFIFMVSCGEQNQNKSGEPQESMNSGKITAYCDENIKHIMDKAIDMYDVKYEHVEVTKEYLNSRKAMEKLLAGEARVIIIARDYLPDEDSLMKVYKVEPHKIMKIASDGLVFFTKKDFPTDTLSVEDIEKLLTTDFELKSAYNLSEEPQLAFPDVNSSTFYHLYTQAAKSKKITKTAQYFKEVDTLINFVKEKNAIGVALMSQVDKDTTLKMLRLGFVNKQNKRIYPQEVHPGYIVQDKYPYGVTYYSYLLNENRRNLPFWFARYLEQDKEVQKYFLNAGILPGYAKLVLKQN